MIDRIKCIECNNMILQHTASTNAGLCGQCFKIPLDLRAKKRDHERRLAEGLVFALNEKERSTALIPERLVTARWQLQPEYYAEGDIRSPLAAITAANSDAQGNVFLVTDDGQQLNLCFTERYAVCEYQEETSREFRCAYSASNLREQVTDADHVVQACPCCGVGLLWYPSRFHMPRNVGFSIVNDAIANLTTPGIEWIEADDFSYTSRGRG